MSNIYFYLNADNSICRDQAKRPKLSAADVGAARLTKKKASDVLAALGRLGLPITLADGQLAAAGLYLVEYADNTFDLVKELSNE